MDCLQSHHDVHHEISESCGMEVLIACDYENAIRKSLIAMKFHDAAYMKQAFGSILVFFLSTQNGNTYDGIIPVPLHPNRQRERGYNQAELIARQISEKMQIPLIEDCLIRQKNTKRQSEMDHYSERLQNVSEAFLCIRPEYLIGKRILLLDDILTSGETMMSAAAAMKEAVKKYNEIHYSDASGEMTFLCDITGIVLASGRK